MGSYIYLGCLCGLCRSLYEQGEQGEHNAHDLINALIKYLWYPFWGDYNKGVEDRSVILLMINGKKRSTAGYDYVLEEQTDARHTHI